MIHPASQPGAFFNPHCYPPPPPGEGGDCHFDDQPTHWAGFICLCAIATLLLTFHICFAWLCQIAFRSKGISQHTQIPRWGLCEFDPLNRGEDCCGEGSPSECGDAYRCKHVCITIVRLSSVLLRASAKPQGLFIELGREASGVSLPPTTQASDNCYFRSEGTSDGMAIHLQVGGAPNFQPNHFNFTAKQFPLDPAPV